jgi:D-alanyl-lipoteichoic acid acyltransferase DltB (MBOAT superfamily)
MAIVSYSYLFLFLPSAILLCRATASLPALRAPALVLTGVVYYALAAGLSQLALLIGMTLVIFAGVRASGASPGGARRGLALLAVTVSLAALAAFKLMPSLGSQLGGAALPLGISFYTFNLVSYGLDVRRGATAPSSSLLPLAAYSTFFPSVTAGPLLRYGDFHRQEAGRRAVDAELLEFGVRNLILGLAKKVLVADPLGVAIEPLFANYERLGLDAWPAVLGYAYQLYFDLSGYTDMAIGAAATLGFRLPANFNAPYTAVHITDFWQRWHMTMSQWFRDYLFLPASRALLRRSPGPESADGVRAFALVFTMIVIGLWHGTTWSFLAWGLYHGLLLAGHARLRRARGFSMPVWASRALTFMAVLAGWVLLRSPSPDMAVRIWGAMAGVHGWGFSSFQSRRPLLAATLVLLIATNARQAPDLSQPVRRGWQSWTLAALLVLSVLSMGARRPFLYFQF